MCRFRRSLAFWATVALLCPAAARGAEPIQLFDGKSLAGWTHFLVDPNVKMEDVWSVKDGLLICKGEPMGYLATEKEYTNFKLVVEWRWPPEKTPGNSGVLLRLTGPGMALPRCVEAQLQHENAGDFWAFHGFKIDGEPGRTVRKTHEQGGDVTGIRKLKGNENKPGEWNRYEITANGDAITLVVNGQELNKAHACEVTPGKIALQSEGGEIHFRRVELVPLDGPPAEAAPPAPASTPNEIVLFNGKDFEGWTAFLMDPAVKMEDVWSVKDGVLACKGQPMGYLRTTKQYTSFVMKLQWRWPKDSAPGNSGVLLRVVGQDKVWPKSVEAQLADQWAGDIWNIDAFGMKVDPARTNGRNTQRMHPSNERPHGEWNDYEITLSGGALSLKVNGLEQNTATDVEQVPGYIALQSEGAPIEFRDIRLVPLE
ncbi:MAG: DUF1080 domain-containing protein [Pirellulales bacterium]|nr:DUF1080 domain-containing protein [Pirellulales bacterium]